jgi:hypothetical protein
VRSWRWSAWSSFGAFFEFFLGILPRTGGRQHAGHFNKWFPKISKALLEKQNEDGSWGSPVNTGFAILTLGVPYRYLPIYQK